MLSLHLVHVLLCSLLETWLHVIVILNSLYSTEYRDTVPLLTYAIRTATHHFVVDASRHASDVLRCLWPIQ